MKNCEMRICGSRVKTQKKKMRIQIELLKKRNKDQPNKKEKN